MDISPTYVSALTIVLVQILPLLGVKFDSVELTTLVQAVVTIVGGLVIAYRRYKVGGINLVGGTK